MEPTTPIVSPTKGLEPGTPDLYTYSVFQNDGNKISF